MLHVRLFPILNVLYCYISTFCDMYVCMYAVPNVAVYVLLDFQLSQYVAQYFLNDLERYQMPLLFLLFLHSTCTVLLILTYLYFTNFSASLLITFLSPENAASVAMRVGRTVAWWLRHNATNRQVSGLIPDCVIGIFQ